MSNKGIFTCPGVFYLYRLQKLNIPYFGTFALEHHRGLIHYGKHVRTMALRKQLSEYSNTFKEKT